MIQIKRAYAPANSDDGIRFLVDRIWPRGVKKKDLQIDRWVKEVAPSTKLRKWFSHIPNKWAEFQERYAAELNANSLIWKPILEAAETSTVTLVYAAKDEEHNNAVALQQFLLKKSLQKSND